ncbi:tudor and KH domain-containing protein homolog [Euwallacea similis]|uniref:tudor and KH domain-containing protein homolog n=1 Tax=Euwallacea similis TaxID=1736056 RepID=UPI003450F061
MRILTKSLTVLLGVSAFGCTSYMLYLLLKKNNEDDLLDDYVRTSKYKTIEINIPKDAVRSLIGRNGSNIKLIQEQSNTRINFKDQHGKHEKICVIRGSVDSCNIAYNLIQEFINNQPVLELEYIWVPPACIKRIIGRGGEKINEIQSLSGAKLIVVQSKITIKGSREQINVARSLIEAVVEESQQSWQLIDESLSKREPRLPPKSPDVVKKIETPKCEQISTISGQQDNQFEIYVSAIENPSKFWVQIVGPKATELDCLVVEMTDYYKKCENKNNHTLLEVNVGDLVAAMFQYDEKWYRAEVLEISKKSNQTVAKVYYVDYGDTDSLACIDLYELRTDFLRLHFQAIECFLARIDPIGGSWSEEAIDKFEDLAEVAQWKKLSARIKGYSMKEKTRAKREGSPVPGIDLYNVTSEQDIDIAEELVKAGVAVFKRGSALKSCSRTTSTSNISVASST